MKSRKFILIRVKIYMPHARVKVSRIKRNHKEQLNLETPNLIVYRKELLKRRRVLQAKNKSPITPEMLLSKETINNMKEAIILIDEIKKKKEITL